MAGTAKLVGTGQGRIIGAVSTLLQNDDAYTATNLTHNPYSGGNVAERIVGNLEQPIMPG
jgi:UDP-N-acetylglucosamine 2-epimerase (non-hydrolysing)